MLAISQTARVNNSRRDAGEKSAQLAIRMFRPPAVSWLGGKCDLPPVQPAYAAGVLLPGFVVSWKICRKADASFAEEI